MLGPEAEATGGAGTKCRGSLAPAGPRMGGSSEPGCPQEKRSPDARYPSEQGFHVAQLRRPGVYKPFIIGISLMAFQQLSGVNAVMFYAETIFEKAKFKVKRPLPRPASPGGRVGGAQSQGVCLTLLAHLPRTAAWPQSLWASSRCCSLPRRP